MRNSPLIFELRNACIIRESHGVAARLVEDALRPMPEAVRRAFFQYHYVEFRGDDRAADHPLDRGDPVAVLMAQTAALTHALQAAIVLHGEPYPYSKWLFHQAVQTPTGRVLPPLDGQWLDLLALRSSVCGSAPPSDNHLLARKMKEIRRGIDRRGQGVVESTGHGLTRVVVAHRQLAGRVWTQSRNGHAHADRRCTS